MGKKVLRLFLETMLRALVIILAIGIVIMGALLIKTLVKNNSLKDSKKTTNGKEIVTEAGDENDPTFKNGDGENSGSDDSDESGSVASTDAAAELTSPEMSTVDSVSASDCDVSIDGYDIIVIIGTSDIKN